MAAAREREVLLILEQLSEHAPNFVDILRRDRAAMQKRISSQIGEIKRLKRELNPNST